MRPASVLVALLRWLHRTPWGLRRNLGALLGTAYLAGNRKRRALIARNLELAFPELNAPARAALARRHARLFGAVALDWGRLWFLPLPRLLAGVEWEGRAHLDAARAAGGPVLLLVPHTLALDMAALALGAYGYGHVDGVCVPGVSGPYKPAKDPLLDRWQAYGRTRAGGAVYTREGGLRQVLKALKRGEWVVFLADEDLGAENAVFAPYFGVVKATLTTPGRLARLSGASLIPLACLLDPETGRYRLVIEPPLVMDEEEGVLAARVNQAMERLIRRDPAQYLWGFRWFRTPPPGEPDRYGPPHSGPRA